MPIVMNPKHSQQYYSDVESTATSPASSSIKSFGKLRSRYGSNSIATVTINEEREENFDADTHNQEDGGNHERDDKSTVMSSVIGDEGGSRVEENTDVKSIFAGEKHNKTRRGKGGKKGRYEFDGEERSFRRSESLSTCGYDSDDYASMASRKLSNLRSGEDKTVVSNNSSSGSSSYETSCDGDETFDRSLISRTVNKMTEGTRKKNRSGKEDVLHRKHTKACKYLRDGQYDKSLKLFEEILSGLVERYDKTHHRVGTAMHNIGIVHLRSGDLNLALDAINVAVKIREDAHGPKHAKVADSLVELGIIYLSRREFEDSLAAFNEALDLREEKVEENVEDKKLNLQVAKILNNIGCVYFEYGELHNALRTFEEALEVQEQYLGGDDPTVEPGVLSMASTMCNIAYVHIEDKAFYKAIYMLEQALQIQEAVLEADSKLVLNTLDNLGYSYFKYGNFKDALRNYEEILDTQNQAYGSRHLDCAETTKKIAYIYLKQCKFETALEKMLTVMEIQKRHLSTRDREIRETSRMINEINYQLLKFPKIWEALITSLKRNGFFKYPFTCRSYDCSFMGTSDATIDTTWIEIKPPQNSSKMAGHKVAYA